MAERGDLWDERVHAEVQAEVSARLWTYVRTHSKVVEPTALLASLGVVSASELRKLAHVHFVLSPQVHALIDLQVPEILRNFRQSSMPEGLEVRGGIVGDVDWPGTIARQLESGDPTIFSCVLPDKVYDLPENRLLKRALEAFCDSARDVVETDGAAGKPGTWGWEVTLRRERAEGHLKHAYLKAVESPREVLASMVRAARAARHPGYRLAASCWELYSALTRADPTTGALADLIRQRVLAPVGRDVLYELLVLARLLAAVEARGWNLRAARLIGGGRRGPRFSYSRPGELLDVYYQDIPEGWAARSLYVEALKGSTLEAHPQRPDLVVVREGQGQARNLLIEVKRTDDADIIRDGVRQVLAYFKDFERDLRFGPDPALLAAWSGIDRAPGARQPMAIDFATAANLPARLGECLDYLSA